MLGDRLDYRTALWIAVAGYLFVAAAPPARSATPAQAMAAPSKPSRMTNVLWECCSLRTDVRVDLIAPWRSSVIAKWRARGARRRIVVRNAGATIDKPLLLSW